MQDPYGEAYKDGFVKSCQETVDADGNPAPINVITAGFIGGDAESVEKAVGVLKAANVRVGLFVSFDGDFTAFMDEASKDSVGVAGQEGTLWVVADGVGDNVIAAQGQKANGMGKLLAQGGVAGNTHYDTFVSDWASLDSDTALKTYAQNMWTTTTAGGATYAADASHPFFGTANADLTVLTSTFFADNSPDDVATYAYDSAVTLGLAGCGYEAAGGSFDAASFDADAFFTALKAVTYESITGTVAHLEDSGSRDPATGNYVLSNFQWASGAVAVKYGIGKWTQAGGWDYSTSDAPTASASPLQPFRFSDNTQIPVADVIVPSEELNLLDSGLVSIGQLLVVVNYIIAACLGGLTFINRKHRVIRASQPLFLYMILFGCCISTTTIIFFGQDDSGDRDKAGDVNCMLQPFFYSFGFIFSFAALFAKVTRIVKIFGNKKLSRVTITWIDMMKPIVILLVVDLVILFIWSGSDSKLEWVREAKTTDSLGNILESTGMCKSKEGSPWVFGGIILALHFSVLVYGNYMCYQGRNAGTAFSESKYVFMAMVSNLQIMALGVPMLVMVYDNPTSNYFMRTGIVFFNDVGVMLLIFIPKFMLVYYGSEEDLASATSTQTSAGQTKTGGGATSDHADHAARVEELEAENEALKAEVESLKN